MPNEGRVYFCVKGQFDHRALTEFIGLGPTSAWNRGEKDVERDLPKCSLWEYSTARVVEEMDVHALAEWLVEQLEPYEEKIKAAIQQWQLASVLQVVLRISMDEQLSTPAIGFSPRVIRFAGNVGAAVDIDAYLAESAEAN